MRFFEDFAASDVHDYGAYEMTRDNIIAFAQKYDPQPFHLDEEAGRNSLLGGLCSSGWHTASAAMRLHCDHLLKDVASLGSPGVNEMNWMRPCYVGDRLSIRATIREARALRSRPDVGALDIDFAMSNQDGERKMTSRATIFVASRTRMSEAAPLTPPPPGDPDARIAPLGVSDPKTLPDTDGMLTGYYDDIVLDQAVDMGAWRFEADDIKAFAAQFDPQPFHLEEDAARKGPFGALTASGWHTASVCMGRLVRMRQDYLAEAARRGLPETAKGPSPGFRDLKWLRPVYVGDTLRYAMTPTDKRKTSRAGWGLLTATFSAVNQRCERVYEHTSASLWPMRTSA